ncbi:(4Fe-4S)-binding protein [Constantimarinum furrinae]|uniref:Iron-binding zinc finger CDGSH type domain-containing protein n=1 Tax=Constantimarinum furrinae TaxID=2562285 RepID=A0A7G8PR90_9FLAO|nr:(4Fe-4S)-binding protein [Constantimarinum furrinae]QNJ96856.1 hypothetical protein ALE3EI_0268 [Constantimarinum furrinae]
MGKTKEYSNGEVTVVWKPELCIHSANCVKNLPEVFKPKDKPWIQPNNAGSEDLMAAIKKCPSGALSYYLNSNGSPKDETPSEETTRVEVVNGGPLLVHGAIEITYDDGTKEHKKRSTAFCRCGKSGNKPMCDGSHNS